MRDWVDIARNGVNEVDRARARKNLTNLIKGNRGVAEKLGYSDETVTTK